MMNPHKRFAVILKTLASRKWLLPTLVVIAGMIFLARLGFWQLDRLEQRRAKNQELRQALQAPPLQLNNDQFPDDLVNRKDHAVSVQGEYDFSQQIILKLQNRNGRPGVHLLTPLLIQGSERAVIVDRGWIPEATYAVDKGRNYDEPGEVSVNGYIGLTQTIARSSDGNSIPDSPKQEWYRVDLAAIQAQMPYPLLPVYIYQAPASDDDAGLPLGHEQEVDLSEGPHLGYAVQWFIFSLMLGIIYIIYVNKSIAPLGEDP